MSVDKKYIKDKTFSPFGRTSGYTRVYSKNYQKALALEFELGRSRDIIMKLKNDLSNKNKEIHLLKINKINIEEEHYKTLKTLKEFLKQSDNLTKETYKTIERTVNDNKKLKLDLSPQELEKEDSFPCLKKKIKVQNKNKRLMKDFIKIDSLKKHITNLNEELNKKNNIITELKNNKKATGYKELQNNFLNSCNEIKEMKKENEEIKLQIDNFANLLVMERDDNKNLKSKLQQFKQRFEVFKELSIKKVKKLDNELNIAKEKERNFIIKKTGEKNKEKYESYIKNLEFNEMKKKIDEYQKDLKKNNDVIKKYRTNNFTKNEENKKLKSDKDDLVNENENLKNENKDLKNQIEDYKKKIKNFEKEEKKWKEKEKEINKLKEQIKQLKKQLGLEIGEIDNDNKIFFTDIKNNKEEENKQEKPNINEMEKKEEEQKNEENNKENNLNNKELNKIKEEGNIIQKEDNIIKKEENIKQKEKNENIITKSKDIIKESQKEEEKEKKIEKKESEKVEKESKEEKNEKIENSKKLEEINNEKENKKEKNEFLKESKELLNNNGQNESDEYKNEFGGNEEDEYKDDEFL